MSIYQTKQIEWKQKRSALDSLSLMTWRLPAYPFLFHFTLALFTWDPNWSYLCLCSWMKMNYTTASLNLESGLHTLQVRTQTENVESRLIPITTNYKMKPAHKMYWLNCSIWFGNAGYSWFRSLSLILQFILGHPSMSYYLTQNTLIFLVRCVYRHLLM